jgi:hypothetical protein
VANVWRNATDSVPRPWQPAEPPDDGRLVRCSPAHCQRFPLERQRSQMGAVSCRGEMGEGTPRRARMEFHSGKRRPVWTASSQKTGPQSVWRGLVDLSTIFYGSTHFSRSPSHLGIAEFIVPTGSFFHAQTYVLIPLYRRASPKSEDDPLLY